MSPHVREIVLLQFDHEVTSDEAIGEAARRDLARPVYEDALYFGAAYPDVQRERRCQQASDAEASDSRNGSGRRRHE